MSSNFESAYIPKRGNFDPVEPLYPRAADDTLHLVGFVTTPYHQLIGFKIATWGRDGKFKQNVISGCLYFGEAEAREAGEATIALFMRNRVWPNLKTRIINYN